MGRRDRGDEGSAAIELVASVPLLVMITIMVIEGLLAVTAVNAATQAARDGARAAILGQDGVGAARAQVPSWVRVDAVDVGPGAIAGCLGVCSRVQIGIPVGLPGFATLTHIPVTRTADFPGA